MPSTEQPSVYRPRTRTDHRQACTKGTPEDGQEWITGPGQNDPYFNCGEQRPGDWRPKTYEEKQTSAHSAEVRKTG